LLDLVALDGLSRSLGPTFDLAVAVLSQILEREASALARAAEVVDPEVDDDLIKPGVELELGVEALDRAEDADERLLRHIARIVGVADHALGDPVSALLVPLDDHAEGLLASRRVGIARRLAGADELLVRRAAARDLDRRDRVARTHARRGRH